MTPIYLDYNATTPVAPAVLDAMLPYLRSEFGNPSSAYALGRRAREAVETARAQVANLIGAFPDEILFTSGGTESSNLAIRGAVRLRPGRRELVTSAVEHPATEAVCALLTQDGYAVRRIQPHADGCIDADAMIAAIGERTALVTLIHAQNEIGVLQPVGAVAAAARRSGALTHADAAQSVGKVPLDVRVLGVDLLSIAGHKLYAPKGVGALYVRRGLDLPPLLVGAGQEHGHRPGTENVAGIVALGAACQLAAGTLDTERVRQQTLRDDLTARLRAEVPGLVLVGEKAERLPNTLNVLFPDVSGGRLLAACSRVCASTGSVCHADREEASTVLRALGISEHQALGAVRLSLGRHTTADDIATAATALAEAWRSLAGPQAARVTA